MKKIFLILILVSQNTLAEQPTLSLKNFRSLFYSLSVVTGVKPTPEIIEYYKSNISRLPKEGRVEEISSSMLLATKGLASLYCKEFSKRNPKLSQLATGQLLSELSRQIYNRDLSQDETKKISAALGNGKDNPFLACTAMTSSLEFLIQ